MASGDALCVWRALDNEPPATAFATLDIVAVTADTPDDNIAVLDYDPGASSEFATFSAVMPEHYAGTTGVTLTLMWMAADTNAQNVVWNAAFKRAQDNTDDMDANTFAAVNAVTATDSATSRVINYDDIAFTDGVDMDSVVKNEYFRLSVSRNAGSGSDTLTGADAELIALYLTET